MDGWVSDGWINPCVHSVCLLGHLCHLLVHSVHTHVDTFAFLDVCDLPIFSCTSLVNL